MIGYLLTVPTFGRATLFELLWLLSGIFALGFGLSNLADSIRDYRALPLLRKDETIHDLHYSMIARVAHDYRRDEFIRVAIALFITFAGVAGILTGNPTGGHQTLTQVAVTVCFVAIALLTAARSALNARDRRALYEMASHRTLRFRK